MSHRTHAIFAARFQPYHNGHDALIRRLLSRCDDPVVLAVVVSDRPVLTGDGDSLLDRMAPEHHTEKRNPWSTWDRCRAIDRVWANDSLGDRITVVPIPRPQGPASWWRFVQSFLPRDRYWVLKWDDDFERAKAGFFHSVGERTLSLGVAPDAERGDTIRERVQHDQDVTDLVPLAVHDTLIRKDDPA